MSVRLLRLLMPCFCLCLTAIVAATAPQATSTQQAVQPPPVGQTAQLPQPPRLGRPPVTEADILRGGYGPHRANNDLLSYHLDIRVDPEKKSIGGRNTIRFRMLKDDTRIQLDLVANLNVDRIVLDAAELKYERKCERRVRGLPRDAQEGPRLLD